MSGILGVWNSQKPTPWDKMLDDLVVMGKDGKGEWHDTEIGLSLGRTQLFNTPESCQENPVVEYEGCVLVWDGRVDDRESLLAGRNNVADAQLIIESYRRWGIDCLKHLIGEFVFILWDASNDLLFVGCDSVGGRTIGYYWDGQTLLLSSRLLTLLLHPQVSKELNEIFILHTICDFRAHLPGMTPFNEINRLLPGEALIVQSGRLKQLQISQLANIKSYNSSDSPEIYYEKFWYLLNLAVKDRLRSNSSPSVMLSGGLDSTTVTVALLNNLPAVNAFSITTDTYPEFDERKPIKSFLEHYPQINWHEVNCDDAWALTEPWKTLPLTDDPLMSPTMPMTIKVMKQIQNSGCGLFFDGNWGDEIFHTTVSELIKAGNWQAARNYLGTYKSWYSPLWQEFVVPYLSKYWQKKWFARCQRKSNPLPLWINPDYARTLPMQTAIKQYYENSVSEFAPPQKVVNGILRSGGFIGLRQAYRLFSYVHRLECTSPLQDKRILELAINLPPLLQYDSTHSKIFLRQVSRDSLPENIRWQPKYNYFDPLKYNGLAQGETTLILLEKAKENSYIKNIIDFTVLESNVVKYRNEFVDKYSPWKSYSNDVANKVYTILSFINWHNYLLERY